MDRLRLAATAWLVVPLLAVTSAHAAETYHCAYPSYSDETGLHKAKEPFKLTFLVDSKTAYHIGPLGAEKVSIVPNNHGGLTFVEITQTGNVMVTAISADSASVHSRSTNIAGKIVPSQYYGRCTGPL
jgi:hypothetical protein